MIVSRADTGATSMTDAIFRLPRAVWWFGSISLIKDAANNMPYPPIPLYLSFVVMTTEAS